MKNPYVLINNHHTNLFDTAGVLLHGYLFHSALEAEEGLDVQAGALLETRPVLVLWVDLRQHTELSNHTVHTCRDKMTSLPWQPHTLLH